MLSQCGVPRRRLSVPRRTTDKPKVPTQAMRPCVLPEDPRHIPHARGVRAVWTVVRSKKTGSCLSLKAPAFKISPSNADDLRSGLKKSGSTARTLEQKP